MCNQNGKHMDDLEKLKIVANQFKEEMLEYISDNWDVLEMGEKNMPDADYFLGHDTEHMTQEEIDDAVSDTQLAYYEEGEADLEEIVNKFVEMVQLSERK